MNSIQILQIHRMANGFVVTINDGQFALSLVFPLAEQDPKMENIVLGQVVENAVEMFKEKRSEHEKQQHSR